MASLNVIIKPNKNRDGKFLVELDADKFEKLASSLGFFSADFLKSLDRAENDYRKGRIEKVNSLSKMRKK